MPSEQPTRQGTGPVTGLETMPSFLLNHIVHKYHQAVQAKLRSAGVSTLQMRIILSLEAHGRLSVGELCSYAIAEQPTMSRALDSLEAQGLVRREMSETDSRLRLITLTEAGRDIHASVYPVMAGVNAVMTEGMDAQARAAFLRQLDLVLGNLDRA
ncbi:MAG: MarR family winged helix-turn-helix transcriptional regulator [Paracoccus sp. (in: a-proteobacteria)]|nr:MarR family winged helix-turn-helix transcriptional regulator [Paracoccus sp. (in: a-proteobacteria)]